MHFRFNPERRFAIGCMWWVAVTLGWTTFAFAIDAAHGNSQDSSQKRFAPRFERAVYPILAAYCHKCHGRRPRSADLDLRSVKLMLKGGISGPVLVPGSPQRSRLYARITSGQMPPLFEPKPNADQIETIRAWIEGGAIADDVDRVYDRGFFETWGLFFVAPALVNAVIVLLAPFIKGGRQKHSKGYMLIFLSMAPILAVGAMAIHREPRDWLGWASCLVMLLGLAIGGALISRDKGQGPLVGAFLGLCLSTIGVIGLMLLPLKSHPTSDPT